MAQYRKDEIEEGIARAALGVFAQKGYEGATVAEIARAAGVSTGNVYRYYQNKEVLFHAAVPDEFVAQFRTLMRRRVAAVRAVDDVRALPPGSSFHLAAGELLSFCIENRLRVVVLLSRAGGTRHAGFAEELVQGLLSEAVAHFRARKPGLKLHRAARYSLEEVYRNMVGAMARILARFDDGAEIREAVEGYSRYHMVGLAAFFEEGGALGGRKAND